MFVQTWRAPFLLLPALVVLLPGAHRAAPVISPADEDNTPSPPVFVDEEDYSTGPEGQQYDYEDEEEGGRGYTDSSSSYYSYDGNPSNPSNPSHADILRRLELAGESGAGASGYEPPKVSIVARVNKHATAVPRDPTVTADGGADVKQEAGLAPALAWWQLLLIATACALLAGTCCYRTSCCFLTADCCGDPFWGCLPCCHPCVGPLKPPAHVSHRLRKNRTSLSSPYDLNESSTVVVSPRRSVMHANAAGPTTLSWGSRGQPNGNDDSGSVGCLNSTAEPATCVAQESCDTLTSGGTARSIRNYKRLTRPASQYKSQEPAGEGLNESLPHVYDDSSFYFSWLHLFGRNRKRYQVSSSRRQQLQNPPKYRHIADQSRSSTVIPVKISKRASTASTYAVRPHVRLRSRSVESFGSNTDSIARPLIDLETTKSERCLPVRSSRLSGSERSLTGRGRTTSAVACPTVPSMDKETLRTLMGSKETTL